MANSTNINKRDQDIFWLNDPTILFRNNNYYKFVPTPGMSYTQVLNALTLFFIYLTILFLLIYSDSKCIYVPIIGLVIIIILYYAQRNEEKNIKQQQQENFNDGDKKEPYQMPTVDNPMMNITLADLMDNPERPAAYPINNKISEQIDDLLFHDPNDVFNRRQAQRPFYTMPVTTIPNDQTSFAKWLYPLPPTCKENQQQCLRYEDIRFNK